VLVCSNAASSEDGVVVPIIAIDKHNTKPAHWSHSRNRYARLLGSDNGSDLSAGRRVTRVAHPQTFNAEELV